MVVPIILICVATGIISAFVFHDHRRRKVFVGSIGLVASVAMYASPLVVVVSFFLLFHDFNFSFSALSPHIVYKI